MAKRLFRIAAALTVLAVSISGSVAALPSGTYGGGEYGTCKYGEACSITLTSDGNISIDVTPAAGGGRCTIQSDTASVLTDDTNGYTLTLADNSTNTSLVSGSATIPATSATISSPAALTANKWGYRIDGLGSFGAGPTTAQTNVSPSSTLFAGIKASNQSADTIAATSTEADPAVTTTVWYGACADTSLASGAYTTQVIYTAVTN